MADPFGPTLQGVSAAVATACGVDEPRQPSGAVDWSEFVRVVDRHRAVSLVQHSGWLERVGAPAEVRQALAQRAQRAALRSLRVLAAQQETLDALSAVGVKALVVKGPPLSTDAHGDAHLRGPGDIDLLVGANAVGRAFRTLEAAGFRFDGWAKPEDPDRPAVGPAALERVAHLPTLRDVRLARDDVYVELHWRLFVNDRLMPTDAAWLSSPRLVDVQGTPVPTLPLSAQWLFVLIHGTNHLWSRLKWLADVPALALRHPGLANHAVLERAATDGYGPSLATGLIVAEAVFGRFLTPEARAWATALSGTRPLVRSSLRALAAERDPPKRVSPRELPGYVRTRFALRRDARYRLAQARLLLLEAGRAQGIEDPGVLDLAAGPLSWIRRSVRRLSRRARN